MFHLFIMISAPTPFARIQAQSGLINSTILQVLVFVFIPKTTKTSAANRNILKGFIIVLGFSKYLRVWEIRDTFYEILLLILSKLVM